MDINIHRKILAEVCGCAEGELVAQYKNMTPQIRNSAILTLGIGHTVEAQKPVEKAVETNVYA